MMNDESLCFSSFSRLLLRQQKIKKEKPEKFLWLLKWNWWGLKFNFKETWKFYNKQIRHSESGERIRTLELVLPY